jgi:hypothetical protein
VGRVGVIQHGLAPLDVGFEHGQFVQKVGLRPGVGLASAWQGTGVVSLEVKPSRCNRSVRPERE